MVKEVVGSETQKNIIQKDITRDTGLKGKINSIANGLLMKTDKIESIKILVRDPGSAGQREVSISRQTTEPAIITIDGTTTTTTRIVRMMKGSESSIHWDGYAVLEKAGDGSEKKLYRGKDDTIFTETGEEAEGKELEKALEYISAIKESLTKGVK